MSKLIQTLMNQTKVGTIVYYLIENPEGLENSKYNKEIRAMVSAACQENIEDRKKTDPSYKGAFNVDEIITGYFEHGCMFVQIHNGSVAGYGIVSVSEGKKEAEILELYITQTYRSQNFEKLFVDGIIEQLNTGNIKTVICTISVADEKMVEVLNDASFEPETVRFRYNW